ncbi:hypothetical protein Ngar_c25960 [Candidatus Nitrososphaera gargensis Ga9.2]|uniref:Uncharacterized protein n=1 Tax=Nitrososphaera gargensis (strain Ga9.2) TaxID=1237085 RepID=K0IJW6_NITGG|nr:hypothetical protein [Candidatus Nitrososphaera gargensis]AFU59518.1 hypothetical protein Ngar_c25960 [Candidatus Nitrososphaera gargensis Ga9.2]
MATLDQEFRKRAGETIENYLRILSGTFPNRQNLADTWRYEHEDDFMYGLVVGQLDGLIVGYFRGIYDRAPTDEESQEIKGIVQAYVQQIKALVDQLKAKRGTLAS